MQAEDRRKLAAAWASWSAIPFPGSASRDERVADVRADLAEFEGFAGGLIATVASAGGPTSHELSVDVDLHFRVEALAIDSDSAVRADGVALLGYLRDLERLIALAREVGYRSRPRGRGEDHEV